MPKHAKTNRHAHSNCPRRLSVCLTSLATIVLSSAPPRRAAVRRCQTLCDFEEPALSNVWEFTSGKPRLTSDGALQGKQSLEIEFVPNATGSAAYMTSFRLPRDWTAYDALVLDVLNPATVPLSASVLVADQAWRDKGSSYWNRHNGQRSLPPGLSQWTTPRPRAFSGRGGKPEQRHQAEHRSGQYRASRLWLRNAKRRQDASWSMTYGSVKLGRPDGVWAFDFGPPAQSTMLGWTPVSNETTYSPQTGLRLGTSRRQPRGPVPPATPRSAPCCYRISVKASGFQLSCQCAAGTLPCSRVLRKQWLLGR